MLCRPRSGCLRRRATADSRPAFTSGPLLGGTSDSAVVGARGGYEPPQARRNGGRAKRVRYGHPITAVKPTGLFGFWKALRFGVPKWMFWWKP